MAITRLADAGVEPAQAKRLAKVPAFKREQKRQASPKVAAPTEAKLQTPTAGSVIAMAPAGTTTVAINAAEMAEPGVSYGARAQETATPAIHRLAEAHCLPFGQASKATTTMAGFGQPAKTL